MSQMTVFGEIEKSDIKNMAKHNGMLNSEAFEIGGVSYPAAALVYSGFVGTLVRSAANIAAPVPKLTSGKTPKLTPGMYAGVHAFRKSVPTDSENKKFRFGNLFKSGSIDDGNVRDEHPGNSNVRRKVGKPNKHGDG